MTRLRICRNTAAATAVEFALTAPLFFMLIFGIVESGILVWMQQTLQHSVQMAARCASINKTTCGDVTSIQNYASRQAIGLTLAPSLFNVSTRPCGIQVAATYTYSFITSYFGIPTLTLSAQACFPQ
jgi:Flp pilus assembly protein TadG